MPSKSESPLHESGQRRGGAGQFACVLENVMCEFIRVCVCVCAIHSTHPFMYHRACGIHGLSVVMQQNSDSESV